MAIQVGDNAITYTDTSSVERDFVYKSSTSIREELLKFDEEY